MLPTIFPRVFYDFSKVNKAQWLPVIHPQSKFFIQQSSYGLMAEFIKILDWLILLLRIDQNFDESTF